MRAGSGLGRFVALVGYCAVVLCLVLLAGVALDDLRQRMNAVAATREILERMDGHKQPLAVRRSSRGRR